MIGRFMGRGNQLVKALYCKLLTIDKQPPTFPHRVLGFSTGLRGGKQVFFFTAPPWPLAK